MKKDKNMDEIYCLKKFITNCNKELLQIATGTLLQIATSFITKCDRYWKLRQPLLQIATAQMLTSLASVYCRNL